MLGISLQLKDTSNTGVPVLSIREQSARSSDNAFCYCCYLADRQHQHHHKPQPQIFLETPQPQCIYGACSLLGSGGGVGYGVSQCDNDSKLKVEPSQHQYKYEPHENQQDPHSNQHQPQYQYQYQNEHQPQQIQHHQFQHLPQLQPLAAPPCISKACSLHAISGSEVNTQSAGGDDDSKPIIATLSGSQRRQRDECYWLRRERNNQSARKSREKRRNQERCMSRQFADASRQLYTQLLAYSALLRARRNLTGADADAKAGAGDDIQSAFYYEGLCFGLREAHTADGLPMWIPLPWRRCQQFVDLQEWSDRRFLEYVATESLQRTVAPDVALESSAGFEASRIE